ncbi:MAG: tetratricopeptide repeat protein [Phycisphaerales bacterium]|nr:tetratricopeptide repeat protein [Phycisphaerales bacterium]
MGFSRRTTRWFGAWWVVACCAPLTVRSAEPAVAPPDPAQWIADYAIYFGQNISDPAPDDGEYVLAWLDVAVRVSPDLAEAHLWRYDLLTRMKRPDEARAALADYCRSAPDDLSAAFNLLDLQFAAAKKAEDRLQLCRDRLAESDIAHEFASDLHRRIAEIIFAQGDTAGAINEARQAVNLVPLNLPAQQLLAMLENRATEPATQVELLLTELGVRPASVDARWRLADTLAALGMTDDALAWYAHTETALARQNPGNPPPFDLLLATADVRADSGDYEGAIADCNRILSADPENLAAAHKLILIARRAERSQTAKTQTEQLALNLSKIEEQAVTLRNPAVCYQIALFHLDIDFDATRALEFARHADGFRPNNIDIRTALGRALLDNNKLDEAISVLQPIAPADADAALALARALRSQNRPDEATAVLQEAARHRFAGESYRKIQAVLRELHADIPPQPNRAAVRNTLDAFDSAVLDFNVNPADAIAFAVKLRNDELPITAAIFADVTLTNVGSYPVTIGDNRMLPPHVAVNMIGDRKDATLHTGYLTIDLNKRYVLFPGEHMTVPARLGSVAIRPELWYQPQRKSSFTFTFTLAPILTDEGEIVPQFPDLAPVTCTLKRRPVEASRPSLDRLIAQLQTGSEPERLAAVDIVDALLNERIEAIQSTVQDYPASVVTVKELNGLLFSALSDASPIVRAKAAYQFNFGKLDDDTIAKLAPLLADPDFLPRLVVCDLFGKRQRKVFLPVLERFQKDPDPLVARVATLHYKRITE